MTPTTNAHSRTQRTLGDCSNDARATSTPVGDTAAKAGFDFAIAVTSRPLSMSDPVPTATATATATAR